MLTIEDKSTITNAILKRLDKEPGIKIAEVKVKPLADCIAVGIWMLVDDRLDVQSVFELPNEFEHVHLLNEIDEIAEQVKASRIGAGPFLLHRRSHREYVKGTGLRGHWVA